MKRYLPLLLLLNTTEILAVPVVPNFSSGSMTAVTRTTQNITETIVSTDYNSGHQYSISGTNLNISGDTMIPQPTSVDETINGTTYTWTGADLTTVPSVTIQNAGAPFQLQTSYQGPGLANITNITRTTQVESVTETTSTFSQ
ncbi:hypothetical protein CMK18_22525 [Candidatus Poribacteria bacterium]|nr:hypothetical protein [Candidatus Poribacteria bacterium]